MTFVELALNYERKFVIIFVVSCCIIFIVKNIIVKVKKFINSVLVILQKNIFDKKYVSKMLFLFLRIQGLYLIKSVFKYFLTFCLHTQYIDIIKIKVKDSFLKF